MKSAIVLIFNFYIIVSVFAGAPVPSWHSLGSPKSGPLGTGCAVLSPCGGPVGAPDSPRLWISCSPRPNLDWLQKVPPLMLARNRFDFQFSHHNVSLRRSTLSGRHSLGSPVCSSLRKLCVVFCKTCAGECIASRVDGERIALLRKHVSGGQTQSTFNVI